MAAGVKLPMSGRAFLSVRDSDKKKTLEIAKTLSRLGFSLCATRGTAAALAEAGLAVSAVNKVIEGRPHIVDMIKNGEINFIVNTVEDKRSAVRDSYSIRHAALEARVTYFTTLAGARAACLGLAQAQELGVYDLQNLHRELSQHVLRSKQNA
jgi:carbamoyl-phosphate synthase large subunit